MGKGPKSSTVKGSGGCSVRGILVESAHCRPHCQPEMGHEYVRSRLTAG